MRGAADAFIVGGVQTDFSLNWAKQALSWQSALGSSLRELIEKFGVNPSDIDAAHVGNFVSELTHGQGHLGAFLVQVMPELSGKPVLRHEAACASGSVALRQGLLELALGADLVLVVGIEQLRGHPGDEITRFLGAASHVGHEAIGAKHVWPNMFNEIIDIYHERYGISDQHLHRISELNIEHARKNPYAQTRSWEFFRESFENDDVRNPVIDGRIRRWDCGQVTDGLAALLLASESGLKKLGRQVPVTRFEGLEIQTYPIGLRSKMQDRSEYLFPGLKGTFDRLLLSTETGSVWDLDVIETHDCFAITEYVTMDHLGMAAPGQAFRAIEDGVIEPDGALPLNPSGGLIGLGHPVGATGVRMALDCHKQVLGLSEGVQVKNASRAAFVNIGGSFSTIACGMVSAI